MQDHAVKGAHGALQGVCQFGFGQVVFCNKGQRIACSRGINSIHRK